MRLCNLLLPYDLYERHSVVSRLLAEAEALPPAQPPAEIRVLDVGGQMGSLSRFMSSPVTSLNIDGSADVIYNGFTIPFADMSFDVVTSIDTMEHLPKVARLAFLKECLRVARRQVIVAAPFGSDEHMVYEQGLGKLYQSLYAKPHHYLDEHIRFGLPTSGELQQFIVALGHVKARLYFAGDYVWQGGYFQQAISQRKSVRLVRAVRGLYLHLSSLALFHPVRLRTAPDERCNRFYLVLSRLS